MRPLKPKCIYRKFSRKKLFRQYKLAEPMDVASVRATLDPGILKIVAKRREVTQNRLKSRFAAR